MFYMGNSLDFTVLKIISETEIPFELTVAGLSMNPFLLEGDLISCKKQEEYYPGDILVFFYNNELIVHRLLKIKGKLLYCKGDNSFLLEHVKAETVLGKVLLVFRKGTKIDLPIINKEFIRLSYQISKEFRMCGYDKQTILNTPVYICFKRRYLDTR